MGTPTKQLTADELRELILGFSDVFREIISFADEAEYRHVMERAPCHLGICTIDKCGHCRRQIAAHQALVKLKEAIGHDEI